MFSLIKKSEALLRIFLFYFKQNAVYSFIILNGCFLWSPMLNKYMPLDKLPNSMVVFAVFNLPDLTT